MKGIYVHIPFCVKKCGYCDFVSVNANEEFIKEYFESLEREINSFESEDMRADSVFFGGGTPSFVDEKYIENILNVLNKKFCLSEKSEITIECNPCSVTKEKLAAYKTYGINRISMGMQSADDKILEFLGRSHKHSDFLAAYENAGKYFDNINADVMYAVPSQSKGDFEKTINILVDLQPAHISGYALKIEENTPLGKLEKAGKICAVNDETDREMYHYMSQFLKNEGYAHYEISNFAKAGKECRHNLKYWTGEEYVGFGAAAHSYVGGFRYRNTGDIKKYILGAGHEDVTKIEKSEKKEEFLMLRTRLAAGINFAEYEKIFGENFEEKFSQGIAKLEKADLIKKDKKGIYPTLKGFDLQNALAITLMERL